MRLQGVQGSGAVLGGPFVPTATVEPLLALTLGSVNPNLNSKP